jgi:hypothetical protein
MDGGGAAIPIHWNKVATTISTVLFLRNTMKSASAKKTKIVEKVVEEVESEEEEELEEEQSEIEEEDEDEEDEEEDQDESGDEQEDEEDDEDDEEEEDDEGEDESTGMENTEDVVDDLEYDVYNLLACNNHALRFIPGQDKEPYLQEQFQRVAQLLMKKYVA